MPWRPMGIHAQPWTSLSEGIEVRLSSLNDLIQNKKASGRTKDLADAEALEALMSPEHQDGGDS